MVSFWSRKYPLFPSGWSIPKEKVIPKYMDAIETTIKSFAPPKSSFIKYQNCPNRIFQKQLDEEQNIYIYI